MDMDRKYLFNIWIYEDAQPLVSNSLDLIDAGIKLFFWDNYESSVREFPSKYIAQAYNERRRQVDIKRLIESFRGEYNVKSNVVDIILLYRDLYIDGRNYIFSATHVASKTIIISLFRLLYGLNLGNPDDESLFRERLYKEVIHELGHLIGLDHCIDDSCVMSFSSDIAHLDRKNPLLCDRCVDKARYLGFNLGVETL